MNENLIRLSQAVVLLSILWTLLVFALVVLKGRSK